MIKNRHCGDCTECCTVLEVDAMRKPPDVRCRHQCRHGCAIYRERPQSCREFTCAWVEGMLGPHDKPNRSHMVIWVTNLISKKGEQFHVIQANVRRGSKRHKKTMAWLRGVSFKMPVSIVQGKQCELFSNGESVAKWTEGDFIKLQFDSRNMVSGANVIPKSEVLESEQALTDWERIKMKSLEVVETNPIYRREQLNYVEEKIREQLRDE